jgi:MipA family protein
MKLTYSLASLIGCVLIAKPVLAQDADAGKPKWELGVAGGAASLPAYVGAKENVSRYLVLPFFVYRGDILRADRETAGARLIKTPDYEFDVGFGGSLGASSKDVAARSGMPSLGTSLEFGPRFKYNLGNPTLDSKLTLTVPLRTVIEFRGGPKQRGWVIEPAVSFDKRNLIGGWGFNATAGVLAGDAKVQNYLYGVAPQFANVNRPQYDAKAGLIGSRLSIATSKALSPDSTLAIFARWDNGGIGANTSSPLHLKQNGFTVGVGINYTLFRSSSTVGSSGN